MSLIHECQLKFSSKLTHARAGSQYNERPTKPINVFNSMLKTGKDCEARSYVLVCPEGFCWETFHWKEVGSSESSREEAQSVT
jgi:hypothetical protein